MTEAELDEAYTEFCETMSTVGNDRAQLFLARFALLAMMRIDNHALLRQIMREAADFCEVTPCPSPG